MDRELRDLHRGAIDERRRALTNDPVPDHVRDGRTLPQQIEGDHAYRDEPPQHGIPCDLCDREHPDVEGALRCCSDVLEDREIEDVVETAVSDLRRIAGSVVGVHADDLQLVAYDLEDAIEDGGRGE